MKILDEITSAFMQSNSTFGNLNEFDRFSANDTHKNVEHIFRISPDPEGVINMAGKNFFVVFLKINIRYLHIEELIEKALGDLYFSNCPSAVLNLSDGFPEEHLYSYQNYLIDVSSAAAQKKSVQEFIDRYYKWLEPIRKKMRSHECLADFEFYPHSQENDHDPMHWEMRRLAYLYLYEKNTLKPYIKHLKAQFLPYVKYIEEEEAGLKEEDMNLLTSGGRMVNLEIYTAKRAIEEMKKMLAALENDEWCGG